MGHEKVVQVLIDRGADTNARHEIYGTALCFSSQIGSSNIVQMLLNNGARVSIGHYRALDAAVDRGKSDIVQMLLNSMNAKDFDNEWRMASSSDRPWDDEIMELLKTHDFPFRHKLSVAEEG